MHQAVQRPWQGLHQGYYTQKGKRIINQTPPLPIGSLVLAGLLAGNGATIANLLVAAVASALFPVPPAFRPFMVLPILAASLGGALAAAGIYGLMERFTRNPQRSLLLAALAALLISFLLPARLIEPASPSSPGVGLEILFTLILMHINVAGLSVRAIRRLAQKN